jgi:hypothetical protein
MPMEGGHSSMAPRREPHTLAAGDRSPRKKERVRILAEMEASSKMYAMLAKLPPCYPPSKAYTRRDGIAWCTRL